MTSPARTLHIASPRIILSGILAVTSLAAIARSAPIDPGTPLDGTNPGGALFVDSTAAYVGSPSLYTIPFVTDAHTAEPGDIVLLTNAAGGTAPSNWSAIARFFNPADLTGSLGLKATESVGFFSSSFSFEPTDFSTFQLFPNVLYTPLVTSTGGPFPVLNGLFTEFGPAGVYQANQTVLTQVIVAARPAPEPAVGMLAIVGGMILLPLSRRRRNPV